MADEGKARVTAELRVRIRALFGYGLKEFSPVAGRVEITLAGKTVSTSENIAYIKAVDQWNADAERSIGAVASKEVFDDELGLAIRDYSEKPVRNPEDLHQQLLLDAADLLAQIARMEGAGRGMGDNHAPLGRDELERVKDALKKLKAQPERPNLIHQAQAEEAKETLVDAAKHVLQRLAEHAKEFFVESIKGAAKFTGEGAARTIGYVLWNDIGSSLQNITYLAEQWLRSLHF